MPRFGKWEDVTIHIAKPKKRKLTNGDRIRKMTDEELAEWLYNMVQFKDSEEEYMVGIYNLDSKKEEEVRDSYGDWLEWLKRAVDQNEANRSDY